MFTPSSVQVNVIKGIQKTPIFGTGALRFSAFSNPEFTISPGNLGYSADPPTDPVYGLSGAKGALALRRGFQWQGGQVGVNVGVHEGIGQVGEGFNAGTEEFTPQASSESLDAPQASGFSPSAFNPDYALNPFTGGNSQLFWNSTDGQIDVKVPGVYYVSISIGVVGGGKGTIMARLLKPDSTELIRAVDTIGGPGVYESNGLVVDQSSRITWTAASSTYAKCSGLYTLRLKLDTDSDIIGWQANVQFVMICPEDPNAVFAGTEV